MAQMNNRDFERELTRIFRKAFNGEPVTDAEYAYTELFHWHNHGRYIQLHVEVFGEWGNPRKKK